MTLEVNGSHNRATIFSEQFDQTAYAQVMDLCNTDIYEESKIRIMPDYHAGKGCTIGTTMTLHYKVTPNLVGCDLGCGMFVMPLIHMELDLDVLDRVVNEYVPAGFNIHDKVATDFNFSDLKCIKHVNLDRAAKSIGTLGGGNHFIELAQGQPDENGLESPYVYLIVHSGSRHFGKQIYEYYQKLAEHKCTCKTDEKTKLIADLKACGRYKEINDLLKQMPPAIPLHLAYLEGIDMYDYLHDCEIANRYAKLNRETIVKLILQGLKEHGQLVVTQKNSFHTVHNYVELPTLNVMDKLKYPVLRKGAVRSNKDEKLLIPMNMRDGSLLCVGKGNEDWNCSAPHGAGRLMSRSQAKEQIDLDLFKEQMKDVHTSSVSQSTVDEAPDAYKPTQSIVDAISDTVEIVDVLKPLYNFKSH